MIRATPPKHLPLINEMLSQGLLQTFMGAKCE